MLLKTTRNRNGLVLSALTGAVLMAFGIVLYLNDPDAADNIAMFLGMCTGLGAAFLLAGVYRLLRLRFMSAKKLRQEEICLKDERMIQIARTAHTASSTAASLLFAVLAFVFALLNFKTAALFAAGAQTIVYAVSYAITDRKM